MNYSFQTEGQFTKLRQDAESWLKPLQLLAKVEKASILPLPAGCRRKCGVCHSALCQLKKKKKKKKLKCSDNNQSLTYRTSGTDQETSGTLVF